jgi:hypothetical protein
VGVSEWSAVQIADAVYLARELSVDRIVSNQPIFNMLTRYIEHNIVPLCRAVARNARHECNRSGRGGLSLLHLNTDKPQSAMRHAYLRGAVALRRDLIERFGQSDDRLDDFYPARSRGRSRLTRCALAPAMEPSAQSIHGRLTRTNGRFVLDVRSERVV